MTAGLAAYHLYVRVSIGPYVHRTYMVKMQVAPSDKPVRGISERDIGEGRRIARADVPLLDCLHGTWTARWGEIVPVLCADLPFEVAVFSGFPPWQHLSRSCFNRAIPDPTGCTLAS